MTAFKARYFIRIFFEFDFPLLLKERKLKNVNILKRRQIRKSFSRIRRGQNSYVINKLLFMN